MRGELKTDREILKLISCLCISVSCAKRNETIRVFYCHGSRLKSIPHSITQPFCLRSLDLLVCPLIIPLQFHILFFFILLLSQDNIIRVYQLIILFFCSLAVSEDIVVYCVLLYASDLK